MFLKLLQTPSSSVAGSNNSQSQNISIIPLNTTNYCFICQKNFSTSSEFIVHIRSHFITDRVGNLVGEEMTSTDLFNRNSMDCASEELWT